MRRNGLGYEDTGGSGPVVVLGHGFLLDRTMFAALELPCRLITVDARGHGETADDGEPFTYWDLARDVLALLDELGIERAAVGGVSQGGFTALRAALLAPERVRALLLFDTEASAVGPEERAGYEGLFGALAELGPVDDLVGPLAAQIVGDHPLATEWIQRWRGRPLPLGGPVDCLLNRDDITGRLGEITCPALLVRGSLDASLPEDRMRALENGIAGARPLRTVDGAWHSPPLTHPAEVNGILTEFLAGLA